MGWIIVALLVGWACGRNWDAIMKFANEKKHTIATNKSNNSDSSSS